MTGETADHAELWQVLVFSGAEARGNPTGIVLGCDLDHGEKLARIALRLGFPDTVFLGPGTGTAWRARSFSPAEEVAFCIQTLLGASSVLRRAGLAPPGGDLELETPRRRVLVGEAAREPAGIGWLALPSGEISMRAPSHALSAVSVDPEEAFPELLVDSGRRRVYRRVPDRGALDRVSLAPDEVLSFCRRAGIHGICLFAVTGPADMALRVFTTSLDGQEDAATGGAVSGLLAYLREQDPALAAERGPWTIQQGKGGPHRCGILYLQVLPGSEGVAVGGRVLSIAQGRLLPEAFG